MSDRAVQELPAARSPGKPQDGARGAGSDTIARFPDAAPSLSGKLTNGEEMQKNDCKNFGGEVPPTVQQCELVPPGQIWRVWCVHRHTCCTHTHTFTNCTFLRIHTQGLAHTCRGTALYSLQTAFSFFISFVTEGWRDCP